MSLSLETSAGYIDSEYSDFEHAYSLSNINGSSPKFGSDNVQWNYNRNVFDGINSVTPRMTQKSHKTTGRVDINTYSKLNVPVQGVGASDYGTTAHSSDTDFSYYQDQKQGYVSDESCRYDTTVNDFRWWCDEQEVSDFSIPNTGEDVTPIKLDDNTPIEENKLLSKLQAVQLAGQQQLSERTHCGSSTTEGCDSYDAISLSSQISTGDDVMIHGEWSSFMKPADHDEELYLLKQQVMERLGFKVAQIDARKTATNKDVQRCEASTQTYEDSFVYSYRENETRWLRDVNELLAAQFVDIISNGKLMAYKTEQRFIEALQAHLNRSQNEIDRLLHLKPAGVNDEYQQEDEVKETLVKELDELRAANVQLQQDVDRLSHQLEKMNQMGPIAERARLLEQKLKEEKASKKALMDDFTKTLGYMRLMKDRLKMLSDDKKLQPNVASERKVRPVDDQVPRSNTQPVPLKGCIKRSNTTSCAKQDRVKFAETSDVYYLPKRSNSELGPFVVDSKKQMPILPCKIRPEDRQQSGGFMGFLRNIKQTFTQNPRRASPRANVLKIPNMQESQTQQKLAMYKRHLLSRGL
ncbi:hypothetical protein BaOVIS_000350 [Babesia ovis]|uniref:Uncharacterized protein n=1 Tax=Babesia ovis TaxID=5869 RepID=A0A9W5WTC0_BABOV|nr:hypothetical protein BaOVIS_000350 [Babesia ovis]